MLYVCCVCWWREKWNEKTTLYANCYLSSSTRLLLVLLLLFLFHFCCFIRIFWFWRAHSETFKREETTLKKIEKKKTDNVYVIPIWYRFFSKNNTQEQSMLNKRHRHSNTPSAAKWVIRFQTYVHVIYPKKPTVEQRMCITHTCKSVRFSSANAYTHTCTPNTNLYCTATAEHSTAHHRADARWRRAEDIVW